MITIESGPWRLALDPAAGGSVTSLDWHGHPLLRRQLVAGVLNSGCFPLVPFSNRLRHSQFVWRGQKVQLPGNHPENPAEPAMHGLGWRLPWHVVLHGADRIGLAVDVASGDWPWAFRAEQDFRLYGTAAWFDLAITNLADMPMPAGLGFHPFFPCDAATRLQALHRGEWQVDADCLPTSLDRRDHARDWWAGQPVASRSVDTVYTDRSGPITIHWPGNRLGLNINPDDDLPFTTIYVPPGAPFFCAEPVSHSTDAFNRAEPGNGLRVLAPGERWRVSMQLTPFTMP